MECRSKVLCTSASENQDGVQIENGYGMNEDKQQHQSYIVYLKSYFEGQRIGSGIQRSIGDRQTSQTRVLLQIIGVNY